MGSIVPAPWFAHAHPRLMLGFTATTPVPQLLRFPDSHRASGSRRDRQTRKQPGRGLLQPLPLTKDQLGSQVSCGSSLQPSPPKTRPGSQ